MTGDSSFRAKILDKINIAPGGYLKKIFITCASFEDRCLGVPQLFSQDYAIDKAFIFVYEDPSKKREENLEKLAHFVATKGDGFSRIQTAEGDPIPAISVLHKELKEYQIREKQFAIDLDITTFTKRHLLLLLKAIDDLELWDHLRILYTEPQNYVADLYLPMSMGLRSLSPISGFISTSSPTLPELLVIFLGYEGDRALAVYENIDPEDTVLVIARPAYHDEWNGRTEAMNRSIIQMIGKGKIEYAHAIDPSKVTETLRRIQEKYNPAKWRWVIVPLGTKPQTLGIYYFWRENPNMFSLIYAQPLKHNEAFFSTGIGKSWILKDLLP